MISAVSEPRTAVNSSLTILMICWAGLMVWPEHSAVHAHRLVAGLTGSLCLVLKA